MKQRGIPIDGVGLQMHISVDSYPAFTDVAANIARLGTLGLEVHITEVRQVTYSSITALANTTGFCNEYINYHISCRWTFVAPRPVAQTGWPCRRRSTAVCCKHA
jgi:hypothetical protein